jgi:hypothetical protein
MTRAAYREIALRAARAMLRHSSIAPETASADEALKALDDLYRVKPDLIASQWYDLASGNQLRLFRRDWREWQRDWQEWQASKEG